MNCALTVAFDHRGCSAKEATGGPERHDFTTQGRFRCFQLQRDLTRPANQSRHNFHFPLDRSRSYIFHTFELRTSRWRGTPETWELDSAATNLEHNHPPDHPDAGQNQNDGEQISNFKFSTGDLANTRGRKRGRRCSRCRGDYWRFRGGNRRPRLNRRFAGLRLRNCRLLAHSGSCGCCDRSLYNRREIRCGRSRNLFRLGRTSSGIRFRRDGSGLRNCGTGRCLFRFGPGCLHSCNRGRRCLGLSLGYLGLGGRCSRNWARFDCRTRFSLYFSQSSRCFRGWCR